ncbi:hypothetical protein NFI96_002468 [Prochilodus magdalenae]|nr:hypothetical protein NFI96_002468 [Prochilodus magdalenae]
MLSTENKMLNRIASGTMETAEQQELIKEMSVTLKDVQKAFNIYFEEDSDKEILIQWKSKFERQIQHLHDDLVNEAKRKLDENIKQKNIRKKMDEQRKNYEKTLFEKSKELALKLKESSNAITDPKAEFDTVWGNWVSELTKDAPTIKDANISNDVTDALNNFYEYGLIIHRKNYSKYRNISTAGDYQEYVTMKKSTLGSIWPLRKSLKPEDQTSIRELISNVHQKAQEKANSFPISVQGYNAAYVHEITRDVKQQLQAFKPKHDCFEFKKEFFVDVSLSVCGQAATRFAELHRKYKEANDPSSYFEKKRPEYFKVFEKYWKGATSAAVLGDQICSKLKGPILQSAYNMITESICNQIRGKPPFNGNRADLEKHILRSLAEKEGNKEEKFNDFLTYMYYPKHQYERFIKHKVEDYMAAENPQAVSALHQHIEHKQYSVVRAAEMAADKVKHVNGDAKMWLESFSNSLVDELGDTRVYLSDDDSKDITDFDIIVNVMKKELPTVIKDLKGSLTKLSDLKMEMFREKPDEILIKHFCRCCWEKCPFCGAVCTKSQEEHAGEHSADFHRSPGMTGMNYRGTTEFVIDFCTTAVASTKSFYPSGKATKSIQYQQYRTAEGEYAKWMISPDFSESVYWKWFVCEFKENLEMHFKNTFSGLGEIPAGWKTVTQSDAIASLQI